MVGHFPIPYPDELLFSIIARCVKRMGSPTAKALLLSLFRTTGQRAIIELPGRLEILAKNLPPGFPLSAEELIDRHTLYPWFAPFLPQDRAAKLRSKMLHDHAGALFYL